MTIKVEVEVNVGDWVSCYLHKVGIICGRIKCVSPEGLLEIEYPLHENGETRLATTLQSLSECHPVW